MREMTAEEIESVSGGILPRIIQAGVSAFQAGYKLGQYLAEQEKK